MANFESIRGGAQKAATALSDVVPEDAREAANRVKSEASYQVDRLSNAIRAEPLKAAAIAAGIGFVFALMRR